MNFLVGALSIDIGNKLIPNILTIVTQLAATLVLFLVFKKYLYKPMLEYIQKRNEAEQARLADAQLALANAQELEQKRQSQFQEAGARVSQMIETGRAEAERVKADIIAKGEEEIAYKSQKAQDELESQVRAARDEIRREMVAVAMSASRKLLQEKFDENSDMKRIEEYVSEVTQ